MVPGISTTGIMIRNEQVFTTPATGYINFYVKDGSKVSVGTTIYTLDESGDFAKLLKETADSSGTLTKENINVIKDDISTFVSNFDSIDFYSTYDFRYDLNSTLIELVSKNISTFSLSLIEYISLVIKKDKPQDKKKTRTIIKIF